MLNLDLAEKCIIFVDKYGATLRGRSFLLSLPENKPPLPFT